MEETIYFDKVELKRKRNSSGDLTYSQWNHHVSDTAQRIAIINHCTLNTQTAGGKRLADGDIRTRYQYGNHLGSTSLELDDSGSFVSYQEYYPYGTVSYIEGDVSSEYRFTGKERDELTGLYYYGARYYASWLGRWISADPSGPVDGLNLFAYVRGNPVTLVDPDGRESRSGFGSGGSTEKNQLFQWSALLPFFSMVRDTIPLETGDPSRPPIDEVLKEQLTVGAERLYAQASVEYSERETHGFPDAGSLSAPLQDPHHDTYTDLRFESEADAGIFAGFLAERIDFEHEVGAFIVEHDDGQYGLAPFVFSHDKDYVNPGNAPEETVAFFHSHVEGGKDVLSDRDIWIATFNYNGMLNMYMLNIENGKWDYASSTRVKDIFESWDIDRTIELINKGY